MNLLINQYFGLGDIIFCMTLARKWIKEGHEVTWPVFPQFVDQLNRAYPDVTFIDWTEVKCNYERKDEHDWNNYRVVPLRWNVDIMNVPYTQCMASKYDLFGLDYQDWRNGAMWERDSNIESILFFTQKEPTKPYRIINNTFGSDSSLRVSISPPADHLADIFMRNIEGYSLFDWALLLENASEIHTVSTSLFYLLELLDITCPIHLYPRKPIEHDFRNIDYLFTKPYILHS